jgi:hypothetical protein
MNLRRGPLKGVRVSELGFTVESVCPVPFSETPSLGFKMRARNLSGNSVHSVVLRCQIMIEAVRRPYSAQERENLFELFGSKEQWKRTLHSTLWTITTVAIPAFGETTDFELLVPCSFDFNVAATKYFAGLQGGEVPLSFLFSGTVFYRSGEAPLQVAQIPWDTQAEFKLPVRVWQEMMDLYYPNTAWLCLGRDLFSRLTRFKNREAFASMDEALDRLLGQAEGAAIAGERRNGDEA